MASTKKLLVAFDPEQPDRRSSEFLIPFQTAEQVVLYGLKSGEECSNGLVVYLGRGITENDLFAKLVDSGTRIENVDETVDGLRQYIERLQSFKIGNVVRLSEGRGQDAAELELVAKTPSKFSRHEL